MELDHVAPDCAPNERFVLLAMTLAGRAGHSFEELADKGLFGNPERSKPASLRHNFALARRRLEEAGIFIEEISHLGECRYRVDAGRTYADASQIDLPHQEVALLQALLVSYLENLRDERGSDLRRAYNKLSTLIDLDPLSEIDMPSTSTVRGKALSSLVDACARRRPVSFLYSGTAVPARTRNVRVYGTFERRGHTYFVGADEDLLPLAPGMEEEDPAAMRVFRDDRIEEHSVKVRAGRTYAVPDGFDVLAYARLPFQYGTDKPFMAVFRDTVGLSPAERTALTQGKGTWDTSLWSIDANDFEALAGWAAGARMQGLVAMEPPTLLEAIERGLRKVVSLHGTTGW